MFAIITATIIAVTVSVWIMYLSYKVWKLHTALYLLELISIIVFLGLIIGNYYNPFIPAFSVLGVIFFNLYLPGRIFIEIYLRKFYDKSFLSSFPVLIVLIILFAVCTIDISPYNPYKYYNTYEELIEDIQVKYDVPGYIPEIKGEAEDSIMNVMYRRPGAFHFKPSENVENYKNYSITLKYSNVEADKDIINSLSISVSGREDVLSVESFNHLTDNQGNNYYSKREINDNYIYLGIIYSNVDNWYSLSIVMSKDAPDEVIDYFSGELYKMYIYMN